MRALVTGAAGFAGSHLVEHLLACGDEVIACDHQAVQGLPPAVRCERLDVTDGQATWELLTATRPTAVYHLAGIAHVVRAEADARECQRINAGGTRELLEACLEGHAGIRVLLVSSAEVYGRVAPADLPVREEHPLRPATAYAASKACAEMHAHHAVARGLHVVIARAFNHIGPRQSADFVAAAFARQIALIEAGLQEPRLRVGNLAARRDLSDVRDTVADYRACLVHGSPGEVFNVASGRALEIAQLLDVLAGLSRVPIHVEVDPERLRPVDVPVFHGDPGRLRDRAGPRPARPLEETLGALLDYWRATVAREPER